MTDRQQILLDVIDKRADKAAEHGQYWTAERWAAFGRFVETGEAEDDPAQGNLPESGTPDSREECVLEAIQTYMRRNGRGRRGRDPHHHHGDPSCT